MLRASPDMEWHQAWEPVNEKGLVGLEVTTLSVRRTLLGIGKMLGTTEEILVIWQVLLLFPLNCVYIYRFKNPIVFEFVIEKF
jgi:hypothetical protein